MFRQAEAAVVAAVVAAVDSGRAAPGAVSVAIVSLRSD
jgi:hypothetical protein